MDDIQPAAISETVLTNKATHSAYMAGVIELVRWIGGLGAGALVGTVLLAFFDKPVPDTLPVVIVMAISTAAGVYIGKAVSTTA